MDKTLAKANAWRILEQALDCEVGLRVRVISTGMKDPAFRGRQVLYRYRNEEPRFGQLQIRQDPDEPENFLWLIRTDTGLIANASEPTETTKRPRTNTDAGNILLFPEGDQDG